MTYGGAAEADASGETADSSRDLTQRLSPEVEPSGREPRGWRSSSAAYVELREMLQTKAEEVEARCKRSKAWWTQGGQRWRARVLRYSPPSAAHKEESGDNEEEARSHCRQCRENSQPCSSGSTLSCMNEFVLLRRIYGRGHRAKVTAALALTSSLLPVALKTYIVTALRRGRAAVFRADGMHMTNEYETVRREIAVQSSLQHPHVCPLYGVIDETETGCLHVVLQLLPYPLMEWVEEINAYTARRVHAAHHNESQPFFGGEDPCVLVYTEDAARRILMQVLDALDYLHSLNIVHKDIKPQNILSAFPPSTGDLMLTPLPRPQPPAERALDRGSLREDGDLEEPPQRTPPTVHNQEVSGPRIDDDDNDNEEISLDRLVRERPASPRYKAETGDLAAGDPSGKAPIGAQNSSVNDRSGKGFNDDALGWTVAPSSSEETSFSESDSDEEIGMCECSVQCTCPVVAQLPESPASQTALAVVHRRLSPYTAYAHHVRSAVAKAPEINSCTATSRLAANLNGSVHRAAQHPGPPRAGADGRLNSSAEPNTSHEGAEDNSAQHAARDSGRGVHRLVATRRPVLATHASDQYTQDDTTERKVTALLSSTTSTLPLTHLRPTAAALESAKAMPVADVCREGSDCPSQVVGGGEDITDAEAKDCLVKLARRIAMRQSREGLSRPLYKVLFERETSVLALRDDFRFAEDQCGDRDARQNSLLSKRAALLRDAELACDSSVYAEARVSFTAASAEAHCDQTCQERAEETPTNEDSPPVQAQQSRKRSRQHSGPSAGSQRDALVEESDIIPILQTPHELGGLCSYGGTDSGPVTLLNQTGGGEHTAETKGKEDADVTEQLRTRACWKVADFGCACVADDDRLTIWDSEGTRHFSPPECLGISCEEGWAGRPRDLWSVGILLYCMFFGTLPFNGDSGLELSLSIMNDPLAFPRHRALSDPAKDMVRQLLCKDPGRRLTSEQLRKHPWLSATANESREQLS